MVIIESLVLVYLLAGLLASAGALVFAAVRLRRSPDDDGARFRGWLWVPRSVLGAHGHWCEWRWPKQTLRNCLLALNEVDVEVGATLSYFTRFKIHSATSSSTAGASVSSILPYSETAPVLQVWKR